MFFPTSYTLRVDDTYYGACTKRIRVIGTELRPFPTAYPQPFLIIFADSEEDRLDIITYIDTYKTIPTGKHEAGMCIANDGDILSTPYIVIVFPNNKILSKRARIEIEKEGTTKKIEIATILIDSISIFNSHYNAQWCTDVRCPWDMKDNPKWTNPISAAIDMAMKEYMKYLKRIADYTPRRFKIEEDESVNNPKLIFEVDNSSIRDLLTTKQHREVHVPEAIQASSETRISRGINVEAQNVEQSSAAFIRRGSAEEHHDPEDNEQ